MNAVGPCGMDGWVSCIIQPTGGVNLKAVVLAKASGCLEDPLAIGTVPWSGGRHDLALKLGVIRSNEAKTPPIEANSSNWFASGVNCFGWLEVRGYLVGALASSGVQKSRISLKTA